MIKITKRLNRQSSKKRGGNQKLEKRFLIESRVVREIIGLILLAVSIFLAVSLITYYHGDPSWNKAGAGVLVVNKVGLIGAYISNFLLVLLGVGAYFLIFYLSILSLHFLIKNGINKILLRFLYGLFITVSIIILFGVIFGTKKILYGQTIYMGGLAGVYLAMFFVKYISGIGTSILSLLVLILFSALLFGTTMREASTKIIVFASGFLHQSKKMFGFFYSMMQNLLKSKSSGRGERPPRRKIEINDNLKPDIIEVKTPERAREDVSTKVQPRLNLEGGEGQYIFPPLDILRRPVEVSSVADKKSLILKARVLEKKLLDFSVKGKVTEVRPGPVVTMFEFEPAPGERISKIAGLSDDVAMAMSALSVRIIAPIAGKSVVGFEIPNETREMVYLREIIGCDKFAASRSKLTFALGKDIFGEPVVADIAKMPHLLIAGATGSGKSVCINSIIISILYKASPQDVKFLLIDMKMLELSLYRGIGHLMLPVITDPKKAGVALRWVVEEMERRYRVMAEQGVKNISGYNKKIVDKKVILPEVGDNDGETKEMPQKLPLILVIIDELADLMMTASKEVEESITRLAHMARAAGIHLIVATQRPSVNVLTGVIKANFPARISFQVSSRVDSRTILDSSGAEQLLGKGDLLFLPPTSSNMKRLHGAHILEDEILNVVEFVKNQGTPKYDDIDLTKVKEEVQLGLNDEYDEKYDDAVLLVAESRKASISMVQRHLRIGYNRAARIIERMEEDGVIGPSDGVKPREVLINKI